MLQEAFLCKFSKGPLPIIINFITMRSRITKLLLLCLVCTVFSIKGFGQKKLTEGVIMYHVTIEPPGNQEGLTQHHGQFIVVIKNGNVRKQLTLDNGFTSATIHIVANNKWYSLKDLGEKTKYAIELDPVVLAAKNKGKEDFVLTTLDRMEQVGGMYAKKAVLSYKNGDNVDIYYSVDWRIEGNIFDHFPGIEVLPLKFKVRSDDGSLLYFQAVGVTSKVVNTDAFRIPKDYKVVSWEQYRKMTR